MDIADIQFVLREIDAFLWPLEDEKLRRKRERILRAATDMFVRQGYRKTNIDEIAAAAGVAKGTVYLYYRNKAELVYHAIALEKRALIARMRATAQKDLGPRERLYDLVKLSILMVREMPLTTSLIAGDHEIELALRDIHETGGEILTQVNDKQARFVMHLLDAATDGKWSRQDLKERGQVLVDLLFGLTTSTQSNALAVPWERYAETVAGTIVHGLVNMPSTRIQRNSTEQGKKLDSRPSASRR